jgi:4-amino-4-deoxy-L-arabinose transferase-like glycosyltransferase
MLLVAVRLNRDPRRLGWCAVLLLSSPLVAVLATVMTPDTPAIFCSAGVLLFTVIAIENSQSRWRNLVAWLVAGLFAGAALVAKYTTVLVPLAILVALISSRDGRRQLTHLGPYLAAALALLIFSPVIHWNSTHEWASFKFQLNHGLRAGSGADSPGEEHPAPESKPVGSLGGLLNLGIFLGGQALVWNPVLATLGVIAIVALFRRYRSLPPVQHVLLWCSIVPLLFFGLASIRARGEMNWPAFAYFPLAILTADYTVGRKFGDAAWMKWLRIGVIAAVVMTIGVSAPLLLLRLGVKFPKFNELLGWNAFAADAEAKSQSLPIVGESARDGACLAFYLPGQPEVPIFAGGASPTAYDYMDDRPDPRGWSRVAYVGMHEDVFCRRYGFVIEHRDAARCKLETGKVRSRPMAILVRAPVAGTLPSTRPAQEAR